MLGYGVIATHYPLSFPRILADTGYLTVSLGKDHFGWNQSSDTGIAHGYEKTALYDGLGMWDPASGRGHWQGEYDDYDRWFQAQLPGHDPQATLDHPAMGDGAWNGWHGAAYVYEERLHPTAWLGAQAEAFLTAYAAGTDARPFLLKVSFHRPHSPYDPPRRLLERIKAVDLAPMARCPAAVEASPHAPPPSSPLPPTAARYEGAAWCLRFRGNASLGDPSGCGARQPGLRGVDMWCGEATPRAAGEMGRRAYLASVAFVDEQMGRVYRSLQQTGLLASTFVLWTADHGDAQGDHFHWRKGFPFEFSAHVPMLLRWPEAWEKAAPGRVALARGSRLPPPLVVELRDVFHTLIDAAGAATNDSLVPPRGHGSPHEFDSTDGKSLLCLLRDPSGRTCAYPPNPGAWRSWVDMEHSTCYNASNHWSALTDGATKYVYRAWDGHEYLFNLTADPKETLDLAPDPAHETTLSQWRQRLVKQFEAERRGPGWVRDGALVVRPKGTTYSPNYPRGERPVPERPLVEGME